VLNPPSRQEMSRQQMSGNPSIVTRVSSRIRELRESQNLSQRELAKLVGRARSLVIYVEKGTKVPSIETLEAFAKALGVTAAELVAEETRKKGSVQRNEPPDVAVPERCRRLLALLRVRGPEYVEALERVVKIMDRFANAKNDR
jgi:transcriptional regulator with XRE-family HTH domain